MMANRRSWIVSAILLLSDAALLYGTFYLGAALRDGLSYRFATPLLWDTIEPTARVGVLLGIGTFILQGLYPGYGLTAVKELEQMSKSTILVFFLLAGVSYLGKSFQNFPRSVLLMAFAFSLVVLPVARFVIRNLLSRTALYGVPVVIFGDGAWPEQIAGALGRVRRLGWRVQDILPVRRIEHLPANLSSQIAILAPSAGMQIEECARVLSLHFRKVILLRQKDNFGSLWVEPRDLEGQLALEFHYHLLERHTALLKGVFDYSMSLVLIVLSSPLFLVLMLLIVIDSPGPVFFRQKRLGRNLQEFDALKFRTMVKNAEQKLQELLKSDPKARRQYQRFHKLESDPRVTRLGKWLRRFSLDELPQLWNVLEGKMSLVGPRAYMASELKEMGDYAQVICRVNPGMTGWWQVTGRNLNTFQQRLKMDEHYISNWSLWMDVYIVLKSFWVILSGNGL